MKKWYNIVLLCVVFLFSSIVSNSAEISKEMHGYHEDNDILVTHFQILF